MAETKIQLEGIRSVFDKLFNIFESIRSMFHAWDKTCHIRFLEEMCRLKEIEKELAELGYSDEEVDHFIKIVYESVFPLPERMQ
jgi:hypothetical protein